jgi:arylsulfatase
MVTWLGGNNAGMVMHWPKGIKAKGEIRRQYASVIDIVATILGAAGIPEPKVVLGIAQTPIVGTSIRYSFDDADERSATKPNTMRPRAIAASITT